MFRGRGRYVEGVGMLRGRSRCVYGSRGSRYVEGKGISFVVSCLGFVVSWFLGFLVSWFLGFLASWFLGFSVSKFPGLKVSNRRFTNFPFHVSGRY